MSATVQAILSEPLARRQRSHTHGQARQQRATGGADATIGRSADPAAARVRQAGGPLDRASYACNCGYVFVAPVTTTVACPHCQAQQAW
jgi:predicted Zn-ribbon and HTH transcriptional regulator